MAVRALIADDEKRIRKIISDYLKNDGYEVTEAENGEEALSLFRSCKDFDFLVLDVMMPGISGWEVCREVRKESPVPILFLTALGESHDEAFGLDLGADDYIVKPFRYEVFMARVRTVLRRVNKNAAVCFRYNEIEVDTASRTIRRHNEAVDMSPKEYELLVYLIKNKNIALERDRILDSVWGYDFYGDPRTVDTHIKNIRAKLGTLGTLIKTVRGFGYKLEVEA